MSAVSRPAVSVVAAGRFALSVGLKKRWSRDPERADGGGGELTACRAWLEKAEAELPQEADGRCGSLGLKKLQLGSRLSALVLVSSFLSLTPVLCPFGDPYDLTARGFARNAGYFLVYCGFGWAQLWLAMTLWAHRILEIDFSLWRTVALPTIFCVLLFFGMYVLLGGPFPLGTVILGLPCFLVYFRQLMHSIKTSVSELDDTAKALKTKAGKKLVLCFALWYVQIGVYFVLTCLVLELPDLKNFFAVGFGLMDILVNNFDLQRFIFGGKERTDESASESASTEQDQEAAGSASGEQQGQGRRRRQLKRAVTVRGDLEVEVARDDERGDWPAHKHWDAARLFRLWFTGLHLTYLNFLFPVLADNEAVVYGAMVSFSLHMKDLGAISKANPTTRQDGLAEQLFSKALQLITSVVCPLLFALLLSFNHWSYNHGMFFMLRELCNEQVFEALLGCLINCGVALLSLLGFAITLRRMRAQAPEPAKTQAEASDETRVVRPLPLPLLGHSDPSTRDVSRLADTSSSAQSG